MTFAVLYIENGDFVADFASHEEAIEALREFVEESPSVSDRVGIMAFDDRGYPVSEFEPASSFVRHAQPA